MIKLISLSFLLSVFTFSPNIFENQLGCESFLTIRIDEFWTAKQDVFELNKGYEMRDLEKFIKKDCLTNSSVEEIINTLGTPTYKIIKRTEFTSVTLFYALNTNTIYFQGVNAHKGLSISYNLRNDNKVTWYMNPYLYE